LFLSEFDLLKLGFVYYKFTKNRNLGQE